MKDIGNYSQHAEIWDLGGIDRTDDFEYWRKCAEHYGKSVLIPFCALGECGAYMAKRDFTVTAFDIMSEIITEGKKRFDSVGGLQLYTADITDYHSDGFQADFCFIDGNFGHIHTLDSEKNALHCICAALREGSGFMIEVELPPEDSSNVAPKAFSQIAFVKGNFHFCRHFWTNNNNAGNVERTLTL